MSDREPPAPRPVNRPSMREQLAARRAARAAGGPDAAVPGAPAPRPEGIPPTPPPPFGESTDLTPISGSGIRRFDVEPDTGDLSLGDPFDGEPVVPGVTAQPTGPATRLRGVDYQNERRGNFVGNLVSRIKEANWKDLATGFAVGTAVSQSGKYAAFLMGATTGVAGIGTAAGIGFGTGYARKWVLESNSQLAEQKRQAEEAGETFVDSRRALTRRLGLSYFALDADAKKDIRDKAVGAGLASAVGALIVPGSNEIAKLAGYDGIGEVVSTVADKAKEFWNALPPEQQKIAYWGLVIGRLAAGGIAGNIIGPRRKVEAEYAKQHPGATDVSFTEKRKIFLAAEYHSKVRGSALRGAAFGALLLLSPDLIMAAGDSYIGETVKAGASLLAEKVGWGQTRTIPDVRTPEPAASPFTAAPGSPEPAAPAAATPEPPKVASPTPEPAQAAPSPEPARPAVASPSPDARPAVSPSPAASPAASPEASPGLRQPPRIGGSPSPEPALPGEKELPPLTNPGVIPAQSSPGPLRIPPRVGAPQGWLPNEHSNGFLASTNMDSVKLGDQENNLVFKIGSKVIGSGEIYQATVSAADLQASFDALPIPPGIKDSVPSVLAKVNDVPSLGKLISETPMQSIGEIDQAEKVSLAASPGEILSLKGKIEGLMGEWMAYQLHNKTAESADLDKYLSQLLAEENARPEAGKTFYNLQSTVDDIKAGNFNWQNADQSRLIHMFEETEAGKKMLVITYSEEQWANQGIFGGDGDLYRARSLTVPVNIKDYNDTGWFTTVKKI